MTTSMSVKPLPSLTYDFVVHFLSGVVFLSGVFFIFDLFGPMRSLIEFEELSGVNVDDVFFALIFFVFSYATGHLISSLSAKIIQSKLDEKFPRPFNHYFREKKDEHAGRLISFIFMVFLFPLWVFLNFPWYKGPKFFEKSIERAYYDSWLEGEKEKSRLEKALESKWPGLELADPSVFHYIESDSKSNERHHAEFIYGHLIQYSFARNIAFALSIVSVVNLCFRTQDLTFEILVSISIVCAILSILFFVRFLDQYKRYTREIYLAFVTENLNKNKEQCFF